MSSNTYSTHLQPDADLRLLVAVAGRLLVIVGIVIVVTLDAPAGLRLMGSIGCGVAGFLEIRRLDDGFAYCSQVRFESNGEVSIRNPDGDWVSCRILTGTLVFVNVAFLYLETTDGRRLFEPLRGCAKKCNNWRRFMVIWRHIGATPRSC